MSTRKERLEKLLGLFDNLDETDILVSSLLSKISLKIAKYRLDHGMSQSDFADFLGVSQAMVSKIESKDYNYSMRTLVKIFHKMGIKIDLTFSDEIPYKETSLKTKSYTYDYDLNHTNVFTTSIMKASYTGGFYDQYPS